MEFGLRNKLQYQHRKSIIYNNIQSTLIGQHRKQIKQFSIHFVYSILSYVIYKFFIVLFSNSHFQFAVHYDVKKILYPLFLQCYPYMNENFYFHFLMQLSYNNIISMLVPCKKCSLYKIVITKVWKDWRSPTPFQPQIHCFLVGRTAGYRFYFFLNLQLT